MENLPNYSKNIYDELLLFSQLCKRVTSHSFTQMGKPQREESSESVCPISHLSWQRNRETLSIIPATSAKDWQLLYFLQERWLSKMAGLYPLAVNWVYPCFQNNNIQINPNTNHAYARLLTTNLSNAYVHRREVWKQSLPHPHYFPLILTRPADIWTYLPPSIEFLPDETMQSFVERIACKLQEEKGVIIVDVTHLNSFSLLRKEGLPNGPDWNKRLICIQRLQQEGIGGLRILSLKGQSSKMLEQHHQFLLDWVSCFGLTANRVELDRWPAQHATQEWSSAPSHKFPPLGLRQSAGIEWKEWLASISTYERQWQGVPPDQSILIQGTFQILKGLFTELKEDAWLKIANCPTQKAVAQFSLHKILMQWEFLTQKKDKSSLFELASHLEQMHSDLSALLEIFSPFLSDRFHPIYLNLLSIPPLLKSLTSCGIHSSAMTSLAGICKAVQKTGGRAPRIIYGENTYFECVNAIKKIGSAIPIEQATEKDLAQVDLLLAQFNPVLKLGLHSGYTVEKISESLHRILNAKKQIPLTLALDCTIDFLDSPKVAQLLQEFQQEIEEGTLNVVGYRSGNKFDLFGMDNYSGAPFFMIHNRDPKWFFFKALLTDPVLQADRLSLQWFCLAYQNVIPQLELYRKKIFENTRAVLHKLPKRLLQQTANYRVPPFEEAAEPGFIDIQVTGPFHKIKAAALVAGSLCLKSMEQGHPIFDRPSLGFYHPNLTMLFGQESSTIRLTLGLDPAQVELFADCLTTIDSLNGR
jgi:hypothetical protein